ncbi:RluA family pseudouridine synthase [Weissella viridescens]|uniref:Pseudouridine synthase n=1 Tax=Weissella viridescens TaxID=1629 RepID=A0A3P2RE55_WEIVI|nr:RluA family pseudouridine synthase [Weissella viridescens]RRG17675.1 RluA family pseudouridine synthase [Weissella viridescens]
MVEWIKNVTLPESQPEITLREQMRAWRMPKRIQGQLRQQKRVLVNQAYHNVETVLQAGDVVTMHFVESDFVTPISSYVPDIRETIDVLFENDDLLVVNKRSGLKTHPNSPFEDGTLMNYVQGYLALNAHENAYMVHRLDVATSGAILVAKNPMAVTLLNAYLRDKTIQRYYVARVAGQMEGASGTIRLPIGCDPEHPRQRMVNGSNSQPAVTHWKVSETRADSSLVAIALETGRTHQIRVHLAAVGHPILGDTLYYPADTGSERLMLHGEKIVFINPYSHTEIVVNAPTPTGF